MTTHLRALRRHTLGFTLLELLVAISVLAFVSMIAWRGLETLVAARERLEPERDEARALLTTFGQIERDLAQAMANPWMFALDEPPVAARIIDGGQVLVIARTTQGTDNPASALQLVRYRVAEGILLREATAPSRFRGVQFSEGSTNIFSSEEEQDQAKRVNTARLLGNVRRISLRFWQPTAPNWMEPNFDAMSGNNVPGTPQSPSGVPGGTGVAPPQAGSPIQPGTGGAPVLGPSNVPTGVEFTIERTDGRIYRRVALVG